MLSLVAGSAVSSAAARQAVQCKGLLQQANTSVADVRAGAMTSISDGAKQLGKTAE